MGIYKVALVATMTLTLSYAKIDFVNFGDICDSKISKSCKNNQVEIKAIQYLLKRKVNPKIELTGKLDKLTKETIINIQLRENIPPTGYIGKNTKDALNKILYGHKLHTKIANNSNELDKNKLLKNKITRKKESLSLNEKKLIQKSNKTTKPIENITKKSPKTYFSNYREFIKNVNLRKSYAIYKNQKLLKKKSSNTLLKISVKEQRVKLIIDGKVALDAPCTTGAKRKLEPNTKTYRDKRTPKGTFKIIEKVALKRSTIFGDIYKNGKKIFHGDRRKYKGSWKGVKFIGHPLKNWMRLTISGIGLHASRYVKRYPGSNGCIRLQPTVAKLIFKKVRAGTKVKVN